MTLLSAPFHADERAAQQLSGHGFSAGAIRDQMPEQHRSFFEGLSYVLVGMLDEQGWPIATLLTGAPGFIRSPDPATLAVRALPSAVDPASRGLAISRDVAVLGIELATRRRNRANGTIMAADDAGFAMRVEQSFGNCPQYIRRRRAERVTRIPGPVERSHGLDEAARAMIASADTFFVASRSRAGIHEVGRVDISHRGGAPGFVTIGSNGDLIVPDYRGNRYFNTLGNLLGDPRAALLFIDFERGDLLQLQGSVAIDWSRGNAAAALPAAAVPPAAAATSASAAMPARAVPPAAERTWRFRVSSSWRRIAAVPLNWELIENSPTN
jgi:predicted pyridoxine 5'-phosphate oxidase superfamily flavin-nucleotide-binding protein